MLIWCRQNRFLCKNITCCLDCCQQVFFLKKRQFAFKYMCIIFPAKLLLIILDEWCRYKTRKQRLAVVRAVDWEHIWQACLINFRVSGWSKCEVKILAPVQEACEIEQDRQTEGHRVIRASNTKKAALAASNQKPSPVWGSTAAKPSIQNVEERREKRNPQLRHSFGGSLV